MRKYIIVLMLFMGACRTYNPSVMFQVPKGYPIATDTTNKIVEYKISEYDQLEMHIYTNDGFRLVDVTGGTSSTSENGNANSASGASAMHYTVENDGAVKLPILGKETLKGMTLREAERYLEEKYKLYYKDPFVIMDVINRRIIVFRGDGSTAVALDIHNENINVVEAIARTGGIAPTGKAYKIKLIRGNLNNPEVYILDLSTMEGAKKGSMILQANDIIYIEPIRNLDLKVSTQLSIFVGILTSAFIVYNLSIGK